MKIFRLICVVGILGTVSACTPADRVSLSGRVTLEYQGPAARDTIPFNLENGTQATISFRGKPDPAPDKLTMNCTAADKTTIYVQRANNPADMHKTVELKSGERMTLHLRSSLPPDFNKQKSRCRIVLTLEDGTTVESREFTP